MDSTIQYNPGQRDASDPEIELCTHAHGIDAGQLLAGNTDTEAVGPRTDADVPIMAPKRATSRIL